MKWLGNGELLQNVTCDLFEEACAADLAAIETELAKKADVAAAEKTARPNPLNRYALRFLIGNCMPSPRINMRKLKDVLRLKLEARLSHQQIASADCISIKAFKKRRHQIRQEKAKPLLDGLHVWLENAHTAAAPTSAIQRAIKYSLRRWAALCRYADMAG